MKDISKIPGPDDGDDAASGSEVDDESDLDLDFDLEELATEPPAPSAPPAPPALAPVLPEEPEVVVFSKGTVVEVPVSPPLAEIPGPGDADLGSLGDDLEAVFADPGDPLRGWSPEQALPPRRAAPGEGDGVSPKRAVPQSGSEGAAEGLPPTSLPPRRGDIAPVTKPARPIEEDGPAGLPEQPPLRSRTSGSGETPARSSPIRPTPPQEPEAEALEAGEASRLLWSGGVLPDKESAPVGNQRRKPKGLRAKWKAIPLRWVAIGGACCALLVVLVVVFRGEGDEDATVEGNDVPALPAAASPPEKGSEPRPAAGPPEPLDQTAALDAIAASTPEARILAQYSELASESARRFFAAATVEEMLGVVRDPERVEPLMREFYARSPLRPKEFLGLTLAAGDDAMVGSRVFWRAKVDLRGEGRDFLVFEQLKAGSRKAFLVDWETAVKYNPMRWDAFAAECPTEPLAMRVFCTLSTDYRLPFTDESKYAAFLLTHSDGAAEVHAYAEREGEAGRTLLDIVEDDFEVRVYLKLRFAPGSKESVEILDVVDAVDWIVVQ